MLDVKTANTDVYTDLNGLAKLKTAARENSPEAIQKVAKQFESLFLNMVLKGMRQAKLSDGIMDSEQSKFYQDMYDQQLAIHLAGKSGTGLADVIVQQLSPKQQTFHEKRDIGDYLQAPLAALTRNKTREPELTDATGRLAALSSEGVQTFALDTTAGSELEPIPSAIEVSGTIRSKQHFVDGLLPMAKQAAAELGVDPKILVAQAALETGWGKAVIKNRDGSSTHNLFNIKASKAWTGKQANVSALEFEQGIAKKTLSGFRAYASYQDSFNDYVKFLKENPRYGDALKQVSNSANYIRELQQAGYATDPNYANKVLTIFNGEQLASHASEQVLAMQ